MADDSTFKAAILDVIGVVLSVVGITYFRNNPLGGTRQSGGTSGQAQTQNRWQRPGRVLDAVYDDQLTPAQREAASRFHEEIKSNETAMRELERNSTPALVRMFKFGQLEQWRRATLQPPPHRLHELENAIRPMFQPKSRQARLWKAAKILGGAILFVLLVILVAFIKQTIR